MDSWTFAYSILLISRNEDTDIRNSRTEYQFYSLILIVNSFVCENTQYSKKENPRHASLRIRLEVQLLEEIGNSGLGSLFLDVVLVQVAVDYHYQIHIRLLEGLGNLLKAGLLLSRLSMLLGKISEVKLDVVSKMEFEWRNHLPRRHEVLEIHDLGKHLHRGSSLHGLLRHLRKHFTRRSRNTAHDSVRELVLVVSLLIHLHNNGLLSGIFTSENDNNLSGLKKLHHLRIRPIISNEACYLIQ